MESKDKFVYKHRSLYVSVDKNEGLITRTLDIFIPLSLFDKIKLIFERGIKIRLNGNQTERLLLICKELVEAKQWNLGA